MFWARGAAKQGLFFKTTMALEQGSFSMENGEKFETEGTQNTRVSVFRVCVCVCVCTLFKSIQHVYALYA